MKQLGPIKACGDCPFCIVLDDYEGEGMNFVRHPYCQHPRRETSMPTSLEVMLPCCPLEEYRGPFASTCGYTAVATLPANFANWVDDAMKAYREQNTISSVVEQDVAIQ